MFINNKNKLRVSLVLELASIRLWYENRQYRGYANIKSCEMWKLTLKYIKMYCSEKSVNDFMWIGLGRIGSVIIRRCFVFISVINQWYQDLFGLFIDDVWCLVYKHGMQNKVYWKFHIHHYTIHVYFVLLNVSLTVKPFFNAK